MKQKGKKSMKYRIWINMVIAVVIFAIVLIVGNFFIGKMIESTIIQEQLEEAAEAKFDRDDEDHRVSSRASWTPHFIVKWTEEGPVVELDDNISGKFQTPSEMDLILTLSEMTEGYTSEAITGSIDLDHNTVHYRIEPFPYHPNVNMVFFDYTPALKVFQREYLVFLLALIIIAFFASSYTANQLTKPINHLEDFAEKTARRDWSATIPTSQISEIDSLALSLDQMRDNLKELEVRDRRFLQSTSHDLKTPVMIIKGYAQAIQDGVDIESEQSTSAVILEEAEKLERRITQLLKLNTIGHSLEHKEQRQTIRIDRMLRSLINRFRTIRPELVWTFDEVELEVNGDGEALLIAFENLIENQLRYAKSTISISCIPGSPNQIMIANDGPQFDIEDTNSLFDPYRKATDGNFGLGLAIVKQVIESHDGSVSAKNTEHGVSFNITL